MAQKDTKNQLIKLIREVMEEERRDKADSSTIKYKKSKDAKSSTIDEPRQHKPTSATIKEKKGSYSREDLRSYLPKKHWGHTKGKNFTFTVFVKGKELAIPDEESLYDKQFGMGLTKDGSEKEFKYSDIEFITVNGKRI
jgi:hypothetical protein